MFNIKQRTMELHSQWASSAIRRSRVPTTNHNILFFHTVPGPMMDNEQSKQDQGYSQGEWKMWRRRVTCVHRHDFMLFSVPRPSPCSSLLLLPSMGHCAVQYCSAANLGLDGQ